VAVVNVGPTIVGLVGARARRARKRARRLAKRLRRNARRSLRQPLRRYRTFLRRTRAALRDKRKALVKTYRRRPRNLRYRNNTSPLQEDLRAIRQWRGERLAVAIRTVPLHPVYASYHAYPALVYAPSPKLDHWVNPYTVDRLYSRPGKLLRSRPKPYILEVEHWYRLTTVGIPDYAEHENWALSLSRVGLARRRFDREECRATSPRPQA